MRLGVLHTRAGRRHAGGKAVFVREMAARLADDNEVYLYTAYDDEPDAVRELADAGVTPVRIPRVRSRLARAAVERATPLQPDPLLPLLSAVRAGVPAHVDAHVDVLLTHRFLEDLVMSNLVDVPVVYQYHNVQSVGAGAKLRERFTAASGHLANSPTVAREVEAKLGRRVDGVVTPGVDTDRFSPESAPAPALGGGTGARRSADDHATAGDDRPVVLFVGRVVAGKGVFDLVDAVARMDADARCVLVGDGDREAVERRARDRGVAGAVTAVGEVDHADLPGYYAGATVCANPTRYEGFGMVNLEAMACGTPLVTTRLPGVAEYAAHDETALLVEPGDPPALADALDALLADPARRDRLAAAGRERALDYSWAAQAEKLAAFCERFADPAATAPGATPSP